MEELLLIKESGNKLFKEKKYNEAIDEYSKAINKINNNNKSDENNKLIAVLYTNRATSRMNMCVNNNKDKDKNEDMKEVIEDCNKALDYKADHTKALFRRAAAYEYIGDMEHLQIALKDLANLLMIDRNNKAAGSALSRVRGLLMKRQQIENTSEAYMNKLKNSPIKEVLLPLRQVMSSFMNEESKRVEYIKLGLCELLVKWCIVDDILDNNEALNIHARRAMASILMTYKTLDNKLFDNIIGNLFNIVSNDNDIKNIQSCVHLLSRIATHPSFGHHLSSTIQSFLNGLSVSSKVNLDNYYINLDDDQKKHLHLLLSGLSIIGSSIPSRRDEIRQMFCLPLLFSPLARIKQLRLSVLSAIVSIIAELNTSINNDKSSSLPFEKKKKENDEDEEAKTVVSWKEDLAKAVNMKLLNDETFEQAAIALIHILQANQNLGQFIITHGGTKETTAAPLQQLLYKTDDINPKLQQLAAEVIALASQDTLVRTIVVAGGHTDIFLDMMKSKDWTIRCHAALSLSKLVATSDGKTLRPKVLNDDILVSYVCEVIKVYEEQSIEKQEIINKNKNKKTPLLSRQDELEGRDVNADHIRMIIEILAYLSLHGQVKLYLATAEKGNIFRRLSALGVGNDRSIRFGIIKIFQNMSTSSDDIKETINKELEQLRQYASKGLGEQESNEQIAELAGSKKNIKIIKKLCCQRGLVQVIDKIYNIASQDENNKTTSNKMNNNNNKMNNNNNNNKTKLPGTLSDDMIENMGKLMLHLASEPENRGLIVQQKGFRLLLNLEKFEKSKYDASLALTRVCISTNPHLFPEGMIQSVSRVLLKFLNIWQHELHLYETLLSITNIASVSEDIRESFMKENAWQLISYQMTNDNPKVQCAVIQALSNLVMCNTALERLSSEAGDQDLKIFLACARADDVDTVSAATGALAMASHVEAIAKKIVDNDGMLTLLALTQNPDDGVRQRVVVTLKNIAQHNKDLQNDITSTLASLGLQN